jgi:hypothetical protein
MCVTSPPPILVVIVLFDQPPPKAMGQYAMAASADMFAHNKGGVACRSKSLRLQIQKGPQAVPSEHPLRLGASLARALPETPTAFATDPPPAACVAIVVVAYTAMCNADRHINLASLLWFL